MILAVSKAVTLLGSAPFVLPVSGALTAVLWRRYSAAAAARWLVTLVLMVAAVVLLKIGGHACDVHLFDDRLTSPSGHAALASAVYGAVGVVGARHLDGWRRGAFLSAVAAVVGGVALSRVLLHSHSVSEALAGLALGGLAVAAFGQGLARASHAIAPSARLNLNPLVAVVVVLFGVVTAMLGDRAYAEPMLKHFAMVLRRDAVLCGPPPPLYTMLKR